MRCFISIDIPEDIKKEIEKIQNRLPEFNGKRTELDNLHLTLKFLGEVNEDKINEIKKRLGEIKLGKFETQIDKLGVFSEKFIRIIWLHLTNCSEIQQIVDDKLKDLFEMENRFMSHLTIARIKKIKNKELFLEELKSIKIPEIKFKVENFKLKKSVLTSKGPEYETLEKYKLN